MEKIDGGEIYTVPVGLVVHCAWCSKKLEAGEKCFIQEDSSSIFCLTHIPAPRPQVPSAAVLEDRPAAPRRRHRREWERVYS